MRPHFHMLLHLAVLLLVFTVFTVAARAQDFVGSVRESLDSGSLAGAEAKLQQYRTARGITSEYLEAFSWLGRNALARGDYSAATANSEATYKLCQEQIKSHSVDRDPRLGTAVGAAIEVHGLTLAKLGKKAEAQRYLKQELAKYGDTTIAMRIQKNLNVITLQGSVAPELKLEPHLGPKPVPLASLKGKPVVLFLWSHWCVDCKAQGPVLARLKKEFPDTVHVVGPTRLYGYAAEGEPTTPDEELKYIDRVRSKYYAILGDMPVPVSTENFQRYGASTSPTMVIVAPDGKVALYHPGRMTYEELKAELLPLIARQ